MKNLDICKSILGKLQTYIDLYSNLTLKNEFDRVKVLLIENLEDAFDKEAKRHKKAALCNM